MTLSPSNLALLRSVAAAIVDSGYAVPARKRYQPRQQQIAAIAEDTRLHSHARHTQAALIRDVMRGCNIDRAGARVLICKARRRGVQKI